MTCINGDCSSNLLGKLQEGPLVVSIRFHGNVTRWAFIQWLCFKGRFATRESLQDWNIANGARCGLCNQFEESHGHLFFENAYSSCVWMAFWGEIMLIEGFLPLNPDLYWVVSYFKNA